MSLSCQGSPAHSILQPEILKKMEYKRTVQQEYQKRATIFSLKEINRNHYKQEFINQFQMRNSFLRPLAFQYVDTFEKKCQVDEIPAKFKQEPDDYEKRVRRDPDDSVSEEAIFKGIMTLIQQAPKQPTKRTIFTVQQLTQPFISKRQIEALEPQAQSRKVIVDNTNNSTPPMICCGVQLSEAQLCQKCFDALCLDCQQNAANIKRHTKCLQRLCPECKRSLNIVFDYRLRNQPILFKKLQNLHFKGCTCPQCSTND